MNETLEKEIFDIEAIKKKAISGVAALTGRTFILQIISLVSTFILGILLSPQTFGVFFVVSAAISFLSYFSDIGLAGALIQKKEEPTDDDLKTTFTIQQILVGSSVIIALALSDTIASFYKLDNAGLWLFRSLVISFFLSSLKTIPSIILERKLEFQKLVVPQIVETGSFYIAAILLAILGQGVTSFAVASIVRGISGLIVIYKLYPWKVQIGISKTSAKKLLSFGIPFQTNSFIALIKDDLMTVFLGKILPFHQIGYIGWAKKWAEAPLKLIMDSVTRVTFPAFARLQHDEKILAKAIEKSVFFLALFIFPLTLLLAFIIEPMVYVVPKYLKWQPAISSFYLFALASAMASMSSPLVNALNSIGRIKITFVLMVMWTALTWILIPTFVFFMGYNGVAMAAAIIGVSSFVPAIVLKRYVNYSFFPQLKKPLIGMIPMAIISFAGSYIAGNNPLGIVLTEIIAISVYAYVVYNLSASEIKPYLKLFYNAKK